MKTSIVVGGMALGLLLAARPAPAQMVQAGVVIRSGPVSGHLIVGEPAPVVVYREPVRRVVVVDRYAPRVIVVESVRGPRGRAYGWRRYHYRPVVVYYVGYRYYDRWFGGRPGLRRVEVYERDGRFYRWDGDREHYRYRGRDDRYRDRDDHRRHDWDD
jgi:hypothetical protein